MPVLTPSVAVQHGFPGQERQRLWPSAPFTDFKDAGGQLFNVKAFGAKGNGRRVDTAAIVEAINTCNLAGGGIVFFPPGTYLVDAQISTPNSSVWMCLAGAGEGASTITTKTALPAYVLQHLCNGFVMDLTVDGGGVAVGGFFQGNLSGQSTAFLTQGSIRTRFQNIAAGSASWVAVWWDANSTYQCQTTYLEDVIIAGPSSTVTDGAAWSYIDRLFVKNLTLTGISRSPNFYIVNTLVADGIYSDGCLGTASVVFDANCLKTFVSHLVVVGTSTNHAEVGVNTPFLRARDWYVTAPTWGIPIKSEAGFAGAADWEFHGLRCDGITFAQPLTRLKIVGGYISSLTQGFCIGDQTTAASTTGEVTLIGVTLDAIAANHYPIIKTTNAVTWTNAVMSGCNVINAPSPFISGALTLTNSRFRDNPGYAPVGDSAAVWMPDDHSIIAWSYDPALIIGTVQMTLVAGVMTLTLLKVPRPTTITNIIADVTTAGITLTNSFAALYTAAGVLLAATADQSSVWTSTGAKTMALSAAQAVAAGYYYVAIWVGTAGTPPKFAPSVNGFAAMTNLGLATPNLRSATVGTSVTTAPGTLPTPQTSASAAWAALS